jgi:hypothetical protein
MKTRTLRMRENWSVVYEGDDWNGEHWLDVTLLTNPVRAYYTSCTNVGLMRWFRKMDPSWRSTIFRYYQVSASCVLPVHSTKS